jgi:hypothetical protein
MPMVAKTAITGAQNSQPIGQRKIATRKIPKAPTFIRTPA